MSRRLKAHSRRPTGAATSSPSWSATSRALASERDISKLLALILEKSRQVTGADAGSVYVVEEEREGDGGAPPTPKKLLHFMLSQNDSMTIDFKEFTCRDRRQVDRRAGGADRSSRSTSPTSSQLAAATQPKPRTFRHNRSFDDKTGYRARRC